MKNIEEFQFEKKITERISVKTSTLGSGLNVYSISSSSSTDGFPEDAVKDRIVRQGIVDDENLDRLKNKDFGFQDFSFQNLSSGDEMKKRKFRPAFIFPEGIGRIRKEGHFLEHQSLMEELIESGSLKLLNSDDFFDEKSNLDDLYFFATYDHSFLDHKGVPVPYAIRFEYINAGLHNGIYDLEAVVDVLKDNPEIEFVRGRFSNEIIQNIPGYNASEESDRCLEFLWQPSKESWSNLLERVSDMKNPDGSDIISIRPSLFSQLDIFDLKAAGCVLNTDEYHQRKSSSLSM